MSNPESTVPGADAARVAQFREEIDSLKLKGGSAEGEQRLLALGVVLMVVGLVLALFGAIQVGLQGDFPAEQRAYMAQGSFLGIALVIAGGALFVRYSLARYLRFWLIRSSYEQRANADRIVDAIERAAAPTAAPAPAVVPPTFTGTAPTSHP